MPKKSRPRDRDFIKILRAEERRQQETVSLIPSENSFSSAVRAAVGSVFSHKYSEGNVGQRYYEGNQYVDELESLAQTRARQLFSLPKNWDVNVQALSGSNANLAVYLAVLKPGDTIMAMYLPDGGHLSHGWSFEPDETTRREQVKAPVYLGGSRKVNITAQLYTIVQYKTDPKTHVFNYDQIEKVAKKYRPKLIITGGTAYPRDINYRRMKQIATKVGALYMADIAHEAGLIAAGALPSPVGSADIVTMTTHKTLRAGRGAIILARHDVMPAINRAILPGLQGGPHNHNIAGICVGLGEALTPDFRRYARRIITNAQQLALHLEKQGFNVVTGGTDKHLLLLDLTDQPVLGRKLARALAYAGLITNYSTMPQDPRPPRDPSALRLGTPWVTTRGMGGPQMRQIASWIAQVMAAVAPFGSLEFPEFEAKVRQLKDIRRIAKEVRELCSKFPLAID